jgi:adenylate cyclase
MAENVVRQRLAAILAADVAGYSRLMGNDERATIDTINSCRALFREQIEANGGRVVDMAGDSVLAIFDTAIGAFTTATTAQDRLANLNTDIAEDRRMLWRIGVNTGDIHEQDDGTVYGDGVNVAARLEALAEPGGICVSGKVRDELRGKIDRAFADLGEHAVKNIAEPVRAYRVLAAGEVAPAKPKRTRLIALAGAAAVVAIIVAFLWPGEYDDSSPDVVETATPDGALPPLPTGPSIAVLPFDNLGGDPEQEYFADGLTEDILTRLAAFSDLKVIARNSSFQYKGEAVDVREVGSDLGATFVLEGSVRRDASSIRVSAQLLETEEGGHVWQQTYDRDLSAAGIFAIQDEITEQVASAIGGAAGAITASEIRRIQGAPTENLHSYECILLAKEYAVLITPESHRIARDCLQDVVAREPNYVEALAWLGAMYMEEIWSGYNPREDGPSPLDGAFEVLIQAVRLDPNHQRALGGLAWAYFSNGDDEQFYDNACKAVAANPNNVGTLAEMAMWLGYSGRWDESKALAERLRSLGAEVPYWHNFTEFNYHYRDKNYTAAATSARAALEMEHWAAPWYLGLAYVRLGESEKALEALARARALEPTFSTDLVRGTLDVLFLDLEHLALLMDGHAQLMALEESQATQRPVIAVLPFDNLGGDPEQAFFSDGITEDIISALSLFSDLAVIARTSTFQFKEEKIDVREIGQKLGADYILEGSVRKLGDEIRVTAQLVRADDGFHLWAQTFDRDLSMGNVFQIQDEITSRVVGRLADAQGVVARAVELPADAKRAANLGSYECLLLAYAYQREAFEESHLRARDCLESAVAEHPEFASSWAWLGFLHIEESWSGWNARPEKDSPLRLARQSAEQALRIDPSNQKARQVLALTRFYAGELDEFIDQAERAIELNPNNAELVAETSLYLFWATVARRGDTNQALKLLEETRILNPYHASFLYIPDFYHHYIREDYEAALPYAEKIDTPGYHYGYVALAAVYGQLGLADKGQEAVINLLKVYPDYPEFLHDDFDFYHIPRDRTAHVIEGLRKAGLDVPNG